MAVIGIKFECDSREEAKERAMKSPEGEVTEDGNYYREREVSPQIYMKLLENAEEDDEAQVVKTRL